MSRISTHVLDTARGMPANDVPVRLERQKAGGWEQLAQSRTDKGGRCAELLVSEGMLPPGTYRMVFDTASYFAAQKIDGLYPMVEVSFRVRDGESHFHIPLLLSPHGYTTYRGS